MRVGMIWRSAVLTVVAAAAGFAGSGGVAGAATSAVAEAQPSLEEPYVYPEADRIFAQRGIRLVKGDGRIVFVDCSVGGDLLLVDSHNWSGDLGRFCFKIRGPRAYLALELPSVYLIRGDLNHTTAAKVTQDNVVTTVTVPENKWVPVGVDPDEDRGATLLELRVAP